MQRSGLLCELVALLCDAAHLDHQHPGPRPVSFPPPLAPSVTSIIQACQNILLRSCFLTDRQGGGIAAQTATDWNSSPFFHKPLLPVGWSVFVAGLAIGSGTPFQAALSPAKHPPFLQPWRNCAFGPRQPTLLWLLSPSKCAAVTKGLRTCPEPRSLASLHPPPVDVRSRAHAHKQEVLHPWPPSIRHLKRR